MKKIVLTLLIILIMSQSGFSGNLRLPGHNNPPPARPHRRAGGEGFPPLPLPVTPLRRSEKKRQPSPPVLVAKIAYARNFYNITNDVRQLLRWARRGIDINYRPQTIPFNKFSYNPSEIPIVYFTGHDPVRLTSEEAEKLRQYVYTGGTILANACCGAPEFTKSFRKAMKLVFPDRPLHRLSPEHPIFHCYYQVEQVRYQQGIGKHFSDIPILEGIDIGCRTAVIFAPADLANGWYGQSPPTNFPPGMWILKNDARRLGANIISYILSNLLYARAYPLSQIQFKSPKSSAQALNIAQLVHQGDWDPNPFALQRLQKYLVENSTVNVTFKRVAIDPADPAIFQYPLVYMTGHRQFEFTEKQVTVLRQYLMRGGVLLAEACCGRREFDIAFRREIKKVLPDYSLEVLKPEHPIFSINFKISEINLTPLAKQYFPDLNRPWIEAIKINNREAVIYSPLALSVGWQGLNPPFAAGYSQADSLRLGVNIILYIMTH